MECLLSFGLDEGERVAFEPDVVVAPGVRAARLVVLLPGHAAPAVPIHGVYASPRHLASRVRSFVDLVAARFAADAPRRL